MKALPRPSKLYGETVCCAGVTVNREWRRLYPIRFRQLGDKKFQRWQWIRYGSRLPTSDARKESRHVFEDTIILGSILPRSQRANTLASLVLESTAEATDRKQSLTLIRPEVSDFLWRKKSDEEIKKERKDYRLALSQGTFFKEDEIKALDPCPYEFSYKYKSEDGKDHKNICHDWEVHETFRRRNREMNEESALKQMREIFAHD